MAVLNAAEYDQQQLIDKLDSISDQIIEINELSGQRYIACGWHNNKQLILKGTAGNNLGAFSAGPEITLYGNGQEGVANTMSEGRIIVHGRVGDIAGYGMRGGALYVRDDAGYRLGIHMKAYEDKNPVIVIGGRAGAFAGEYMAGGTIIVLGMEPSSRPLIGPHCGTGIYGGCIYLRGEFPARNLAANIRSQILTGREELQSIMPYLQEFGDYFDYTLEEILKEPFTRLTYALKRPFAHMYTGFVS